MKRDFPKYLGRRPAPGPIARTARLPEIGPGAGLLPSRPACAPGIPMEKPG